MNNLDSYVFSEVNSISNYKSSLDYNCNINSQEVNKYTRAVLAIIYREYICEPDERNRLLEFDEECFRKEYEIEKKK